MRNPSSFCDSNHAHIIHIYVQWHFICVMITDMTEGYYLCFVCDCVVDMQLQDGGWNLS